MTDFWVNRVVLHVTGSKTVFFSVLLKKKAKIQGIPTSQGTTTPLLTTDYFLKCDLMSEADTGESGEEGIVAVAAVSVEKNR